MKSEAQVNHQPRSGFWQKAANQMARCAWFAAIAIAVCPARAEWTNQESHLPRASFRAIQAISEKVAWVSGTSGNCLRTLDGGTTWDRLPIPGAEKLDFRGLAALGDHTAVLISSGDGAAGQACIYRTEDGGKNWRLVCQTWEPGAFFDNICFWDSKNGLVCGDPVDDKLYLLRTTDGGRSWERVRNAKLPTVLPGEGAFAAGNSAMRMQGSSKVWIATGAGERSRVFISDDRGANWQISETPMPAGESAGVFGICFWDRKHGIGVGGDYKRALAETTNVILTVDGGRSWSLGEPTDPPGHKESVAMLHGGKLVVIGPSGTSLSTDAGKTWQKVDNRAFHAIACSGNACWAVGSRGAIAKWK